MPDRCPGTGGRPQKGYACTVPPDRPLTPAERAVIADLEQRLLLDSPVPERSGSSVRADVARPVRAHPSGSGTSRARRLPSVPVLALLGAAVALLAISALAGAGALGAAAVAASVLATGLVWRLLPVHLGGPVRPPRPPSRAKAWLTRPR